jgi:hypothetical protein
VVPSFAKTFDWIWDDSAAFKDWIKNGSGVFWITGKPGSGKSTLMRYLVLNPKLRESVQRIDTAHLTEPIIASHFFEFDKNVIPPLARTKEGMLRAILWQIMRQSPQLLRFALPDYSAMKQQRKTISWTSTTLETIFRSVVSSPDLPPTFIFVDALDEFPGEHHRSIAEFLESVSFDMTKDCRLVLASRP